MEKVLSITGYLCLVLIVSTADAAQKFARCKLRPNTNSGAAALIANQKLSGTILFEEKEDGTTTISGTVSGFSGPNNMKHGFHIHAEANEANNCDLNAGHFNPEGVNHGSPTSEVRHYGDLGNLIVQNGKATVGTENQNSYVKLIGDNNVIGKSIVIHERVDDLGTVDSQASRTTGDAGGRLACCVIEAYEKVKYVGVCEMKDNTFENAPGSGGFSGTINLVQDLSQEAENDRRTKIQGIVKGFNSTDSVTKHGFHIHVSADSGNNCNNNEGHYNPENIVHGGPSTYPRHYGDLGNIDERNGQASVDITDDYVELFGLYSVHNRSIVVHERADDLGTVDSDASRSTGDAGGRLACCKIIVTEETSAAYQKTSSFTLMSTLLFVVALLWTVS